jgi:hypothetical protein
LRCSMFCLLVVLILFSSDDDVTPIGLESDTKHNESRCMCMLGM